MIQRLTEGLEQFRNELEKRTSLFDIQKIWSNTMDSVVRELFETNPSQNSRMAVFALGGYGREEMSPYSDVDLMFLYEGDLKVVQKTVDGVLYPLWDSKFEAGGATRALGDCAAMFEGEIRAQTAMLDVRFIAGDRELADRFFKLLHGRFKSRLWKRRFARAKYKEQEARFAKFGNSVYVLEPHVKESEGGLREVQTAQWIDKVLFNNAHEKILSGMEGEVEFLFRLRAHLHLLAGKREDRLTFENQKAIAARLNQPIEELMARYYKATSLIHGGSKGITYGAAPLYKRMIRHWRHERIKKIIGGAPSWQRLAANPDVLYRALLIMHETGDIVRLIPSFKDIYFRTQYGAYHVYTVDVHSMFTVKRLLELEKDETHHLLHEVYKKIGNKSMLLLAALLHDIGKLPEKHTSHVHLGAEIAKKEALKLGFSSHDADRISFLVESHLIMPRIAFNRDLADPHLIENFANSVGDEELLDMLLVLSYADIASIGPDVWSAWKEKLLGELYNSSKKYIAGFKAQHLKKEIDLIKKTAIETYDGHVRIWFSSMPERYFMAHNIDCVMCHVDMFRNFTTQPILVKHAAKDNHSEFIIMTRDAPGIFSKISGVMTAHNVDILEADLNTGRNGVVLDVLRVVNEIGGPVPEQLALRVIKTLEDVFACKKEVDELIKKRAVIFKKRVAPVTPRVVMDNDVSAFYTVVDIMANDRVGLLFDLASVIFKEGYSIGVAKILTDADTAKDSFYIKDLKGEKITAKEQLDSLRESILKVL
ncbi:MAG: hypothetical protein COX62_07220 [Deltaproteobacteria bacterium CG_4_10_14_0_2_um_filter_43_8]|nr:MAG: hypothetical protein COV46_07125 [Deltaproteobacteria bacterium CG11_big_fil_rev_8_21_14_0_20_49_13]PJA19146.1 MAG: hypothetical protein COX62_07220 [Deltaproteobacteria bacterium CG_4_10_14_0_2_um_filter_43_8]